MVNSKHRYCVIMCGGIGSRFWPYSRARLPKQFLDFLGIGRTLLQMSFDRLVPMIPAENILVVTSERYADLVAQQLPEIPVENILLEPARRNTAPCVAWASWHIAARDPQASIIVAPSDHLITRDNIFQEAVLKGFSFVESNDALLTFGIEPTRPETGYGYIQIDDAVADNIRRVKTFTEKPDAELAKVFISTGEFFWNSGIFMWTAKSICDAFRRYSPDIAAEFDSVPVATFCNPAVENEYIAKAYPSCVSISVDYAVMEKATNVYVETVNFGWSDIGTWGALYDISPKNADSNVTHDINVLSYNSRGNIFAVRGESDRLVVVNGLEDYIIADADGVLLIWPRNQEQKIRQVVNDVKVKFGEKFE